MFGISFGGKKKKKERPGGRVETRHRVSPETKKSIVAVLLFGVSIVLVLASVGRSGPAGNFVFTVLSTLLGLGYYLIPFIAFLVAFFLLFSHERKILGMSLFGAGFFVIAGLGLIDVLFPDKGGILGQAIGSIEALFGYLASIIILSLLLLISLLIAFNTPLRFGSERKPKEKALIIHEAGDGDRDDDSEAEEPNPEPVTKIKIKENKKDEEPDEMEVKENTAGEIARTLPRPISSKNYVPPPLSLLTSQIEKPTSGDLRANANIIKRTLESFGIPVEMGEINIGPKVTRYTLKPAEGVNLTKIIALQRDFELALAAHPIRIEAPIPGKALVGIEVPNKAAAIVRLGSIMAYKDFGIAGPLTFALGRDVTGEPIFSNIEKMPHLLIAGSTGSGKSVAIHTLILSLLFKNAPDTLRLLLIDPKRVELSIYEHIPHLVAPVITEAKKTVGAFRWAIKEMERRYEVLLRAGVRDIKSFNKQSDEPLPYIVIVVDELADLMASYGREIEGSIVRLAQMARATGIHLILSTQRPSVEVITGLIKANITARIALQVASQIDSRTILDLAGAEKLLGGGDLLFISSDYSKPKRIQGSYVSEEEIHAVTDFIRDNNELADAMIASAGTQTENQPLQDALIRQPEDMFGGDADDDDELYQEAVGVVREAKKASASLLQRRLKVGYARAARLIDIMEERGVVGPGEGAKPREVYEAPPEALE